MNLAFKAGFFFFAMSGYQFLVEGRGGGKHSFLLLWEILRWESQAESKLAGRLSNLTPLYH